MPHHLEVVTKEKQTNRQTKTKRRIENCSEIGFNIISSVMQMEHEFEHI